MNIELLLCIGGIALICIALVIRWAYKEFVETLNTFKNYGE